MSDETSSNDEKGEFQPEFKKPVLFGRIGKLPKKVKREPEKVPEDKNEEKPEPIDSGSKTESGPKSSLPPAVLLKELSTPIPYKEPKWSGLCPDGSEYALEVLKSGCIMERIDLTTKPYLVFGRLANCDVVMAHPTISRHHCVIQYKAFADEGEQSSGWYMYDLGSTHGTFLNKVRLKSSHYTRVRVGHQIKFGNSTRTYVVLGPDFDSEGESELSVSEIKQRAEVMRVERDRMIQDAKEQRDRERKEEEKKIEDQGIDWGMGEDAEDEPDLSDNPFAVTTNEELYLDDPKKTLRGYFEREGHELSYDCQERGHGQYICRVELPLDDARGRPVVAEAIHTGKKKEAVIACALEACRVLDRAGLLRQAKHESRRRKSRDWGADDYYDSDEDTFLDRTGSVERKRKQRMQKHGAAPQEQEGPLSYDDLTKRIQEIEGKISAEESSLERLRESSKSQKQSSSETDDLDAYMFSLNSAPCTMSAKADISRTKRYDDKRIKLATEKYMEKNTSNLVSQNICEESSLERLRESSKSQRQSSSETNDLDAYMFSLNSAPCTMAAKADISGTKMSIQKLKAELSKTHRLAEIARPPHLPPLIKKHDSKMAVKVNNSVVYGKRIKLKDDAEKRPKPKPKENKQDDEFVEEVDSDEENPENSNRHDSAETVTRESEIENKHDSEKTEMQEEKVKKTYGPMRPPENYVIPEDYFSQQSDRDLPEIMEKE